MVLSLLKAYYWLEGGVREYVRSCGAPEFTRSQAMLMANIILGYNKPSEIARQLDISRQAVHLVIKQMITKNILALQPDPNNRRIKQVVLTKLGAKMRDDGVIGMAIVTAELGKRIGKTNVNKLALLLNADWGPAPTVKGLTRKSHSKRGI
jgi:DNA-binding MarR family transcriptional regulator